MLTFCTFYLLPLSVSAVDGKLTSGYSFIQPITDGNLDYVYELYGEKAAIWIDPISDHKASYNYLYIMNDLDNLYIFWDLCSDNSTEPSDVFVLFIDAIWNPRDVSAVFNVYVFEIYPDSNTTFPLDTPFDYAYNFAPSINSPSYSHVQWEVRIPLDSICKVPPSIILDTLPFPREIGLGFVGLGTLLPEYSFPSLFDNELTWTYAQVLLSTIPFVEFSHVIIGSILLIAGVIMLGNEMFNRFFKKQSTRKWWNIAGDIAGGVAIFFGAVFLGVGILAFL